VWCQIVADVCRLPVTILEQTEGASFGAALQALWALERREDSSLSVEQVVAAHLSRDEALCVEPRSAAADLYATHYTEYQQAVRNITPLYKHDA
ncbi:MAG: FGGY-family carbohydrate kinase, partial [Woeseiaceae bacterium]